MNESEDTRVNHFGALVEHLSQFPRYQLGSLAVLYGVGEAEASAIARHWCRHPEAFLEVLDDELSSASWEALEDLAYEHDVPVSSEWIPPAAREELAKVGILQAFDSYGSWSHEIELPGALAAILAPRLAEARPTLPILLGRLPEEEVVERAAVYGVDNGSSKIETILQYADFMCEPQVVEAIVSQLPHPDWLGAAMSVLELGGFCYWREIFAGDLEDDEPDDANVVPLMGEDERFEQQRIAERLLELGVVFRIEEEAAEFPMVAVPEELWGPLWSVGRGWMLDWTRQSYMALRDQAQGGESPEVEADLQTVGKWWVAEAESGSLIVDDEAFDAPSREQLVEIDTTPDAFDIDTCLPLLRDLSVLQADQTGRLVAGPESRKLLNMSRPDFVRNTLYEWCGGFIGREIDDALPRAIGLDDVWRDRAIELLRARREFVPVWMNSEGLPPERTGAGCLRDPEEGMSERIATEIEVANSYVWGLKLLWLDLLTLLDRGRWYSRDLMAELLRMSASISLFSQLGHLLQDPGAQYYAPVQRASFLNDPTHAAAFETWTTDLVEHLLAPLGAARFDASGERIWLNNELLKVKSPPGWPPEERIQLVEDVFQTDEIDFEPEKFGDGRNLRPVSTTPAPTDTTIELRDVDLDDLLEVVGSRDIVGFDGEQLEIASEHS